MGLLYKGAGGKEGCVGHLRLLQDKSRQTMESKQPSQSSHPNQLRRSARMLARQERQTLPYKCDKRKQDKEPTPVKPKPPPKTVAKNDTILSTTGVGKADDKPLKQISQPCKRDTPNQSANRNQKSPVYTEEQIVVLMDSLGLSRKQVLYVLYGPS